MFPPPIKINEYQQVEMKWNRAFFNWVTKNQTQSNPDDQSEKRFTLSVANEKVEKGTLPEARENVADQVIHRH